MAFINYTTSRVCVHPEYSFPVPHKTKQNFTSSTTTLAALSDKGTDGSIDPPNTSGKQKNRHARMAVLHFSFAPVVAHMRRRRHQIRSSADRQSLFNRIAPVYDNLNDVFSLGQHRVWKRMAVSWSGAKEGGNALDLCCGSGDLAFLLSQKVGLHGQVIGLDFSREQLMVASSRQQLHSKACYRNLKWVEGDALDLPFPDSHFDAVTMGYGLRNVVDKYKAMKEVHRVLKPGSKASILDLNKSTDGFLTSIQSGVFTGTVSLSLGAEGFVVDIIIVPVAAGYGLSEEYQYLKRSIQEFLTGKELEHLALEAGFSSAKHFEVGGGFMGNLVATR